MCDPSGGESQWRSWVQHIVPYLMPACAFHGYPESSHRETCMPGDYYHYSNVGYSLLGLALDQFLKREVSADLSLEDWIEERIFKKIPLNNTAFTWTNLTSNQHSRTAHGCYGGKSLGECDFLRALTDYADRGLKTPPGGMWSTASDLVNYLLTLPELDDSMPIRVDGPMPAIDAWSEEDPLPMPSSVFYYTHGWYVSPAFSCDADKHTTYLQGAWGTVPGFTSYMITNPKPAPGQDQYAVVLLRSYNEASRLNLGNQARKLLWRLLYPDQARAHLKCPVVATDLHPEGDHVIFNANPLSASKNDRMHAR